ncbi:BTAD domain-containing putative transcriptional regulator [Glycomyces xiaoerkulensis]|uniref:BTAD domain-containing putative transcriptional regulator n=1 Tax=Glycomyces xiaoerkulensis TaxID=2038139 RepID=UPI000C263048|nr:BTAD domain-containing putative transcriptional regulator [Glycomyces xiaoerkulensis]
MRIELLGPLRTLDSSGAEITVPAGRQRALLARLALDPGRVVPAASLIDALWASAPPANATGALHTQVSRLRRLLGDDLESTSGGYRLTGTTTDIEDFERLAADTEAASRSRSAGSVRRHAERALRLWRGPALGDAADYGFADAAVTRLITRREAVASLLIEARLELEGAEPVLGELAARSAADPLSEADAARYMRALAAAGRQAEALAVYEKVRSRLADELGVDPSASLSAAHLDVLRGVEPAPAADPPSHLPEPLTACIGRESDTEALLSLIDANRLVTLTGPGGTGKTRLAVEIAHRIEDGGLPVRLAELASLDDARRLPEVLLEALHVGESILSRGHGDTRERLFEVLRNRELLLVVDNCEHLVDGVAALLAELVAKAPKLRVLTTGREALGITGEAVYALGPLGHPGGDATTVDPESQAAVRLLLERGHQSDASFRITGGNAPLVARVCSALDGLPLAIELAAARLRTMSLEEIASRLDDRFSLLNRGDRTAAPRQRTLRGVVDWSWDLLQPHERRVLARMSVFGGDAELEAVTAVCSASVDAVADLVDKSLVQRLPGGRYRLLETVREYASERLAEFGETADAYRAHADHFIGLAERAEPHLMRAEQVEWLRRLAADHAELVAAIRRMIAAGDADRAGRLVAPLSWYWWMRGHRDEGTELARRVRAMDGGLDPAHRAKVAMSGTWGLWSGVLDPEEIDAGWELAERLAEEHGLYETEPLTKIVPVLRALLAGDAEALRRAGARLDGERDAWVKGIYLMIVSDFTAREGDRDRATAELHEALAIFESIGERFGLVTTLQALALDDEARGDRAGAARLLARALRAESEFGAEITSSVIIDQVWRLEATYGDDPEATLAKLRAEARRAADVGALENAMSARISAASCLRRLGRTAEARDELLAAESDRPRFVELSEVSNRLYRVLAEVAGDLGDADLERRAAEVAESSQWPFSS